jgi:hypothetical protein
MRVYCSLEEFKLFTQLFDSLHGTKEILPEKFPEILKPGVILNTLLKKEFLKTDAFVCYLHLMSGI